MSNAKELLWLQHQFDVEIENLAVLRNPVPSEQGLESTLYKMGILWVTR